MQVRLMVDLFKTDVIDKDVLALNTLYEACRVAV